ncbi:MAG: inositol monophosphatase, partial [Myxococcales bacterium]|nr:inositol monophosphatase [Myxococcales bacterium]
MTQPLGAFDFPGLLGAALEAAREAAALVQTGWRNHPTAAHKRARVDLVTQFDRRSETLLRERLTRTTPFPVVGEEEGGRRASESERATWFVDPLDGTTNFVHGHPFWCVSLGLVAGSTPLLGVVVAPSLHVEWTAVPGSPPLRNGVPCAVSDVALLDDALLATGFPYDRRTNPDNNFDAFVAIKKKCQAVRRCGSAAIDLCLVADGTYDGYWEKRLGPWDVAGGCAMVLAAGGRITGYSGQS